MNDAGATGAYFQDFRVADSLFANWGSNFLRDDVPDDSVGLVGGGFVLILLIVLLFILNIPRLFAPNEDQAEKRKNKKGDKEKEDELDPWTLDGAAYFPSEATIMFGVFLWLCLASVVRFRWFFAPVVTVVYAVTGVLWSLIRLFIYVWRGRGTPAEISKIIRCAEERDDAVRYELYVDLLAFMKYKLLRWAMYWPFFVFVTFVFEPLKSLADNFVFVMRSCFIFIIQKATAAGFYSGCLEKID